MKRLAYISDVSEIKDALDETLELLNDWKLSDETLEEIDRLVANVYNAAAELRGYAASIDEDEDYDPDEDEDQEIDE